MLDCDGIFHDEAKFLLRVEGGGAKSMMTEACDATNSTMMEVGEAISSIMKVCGATKSTLSKSVR